MRLASVQKFLEDLDLPLESAAHSGGCRLSGLWMSLGFLMALASMKTLQRRQSRSASFDAARQSWRDLRLREHDRSFPRAVKCLCLARRRVVRLDTLENFFDLLKQ